VIGTFYRRVRTQNLPEVTFYRRVFCPYLRLLRPKCVVGSLRRGLLCRIPQFGCATNTCFSVGTASMTLWSTFSSRCPNWSLVLMFTAFGTSGRA
jgi:hypothetical protein